MSRPLSFAVQRLSAHLHPKIPFIQILNNFSYFSIISIFSIFDIFQILIIFDFFFQIFQILIFFQVLIISIFFQFWWFSLLSGIFTLVVSISRGQLIMHSLWVGEMLDWIYKKILRLFIKKRWALKATERRWIDNRTTCCQISFCIFKHVLSDDVGSKFAYINVYQLWQLSKRAN